MGWGVVEDIEVRFGWDLDLGMNVSGLCEYLYVFYIGCLIVCIEIKGRQDVFVPGFPGQCHHFLPLQPRWMANT